MQTQALPKISLKEACVQAAHEFIAEKGIENLSMRDVARRLEVSHQAPYRHYASKDHLLSAVIARCFRDFANFLDARPDFENPNEALKAMGQQYMSYATSHPLEYRLMFGTTWPQAAVDSELIRDAQHAFNVLRNVLQRMHGTSEDAKKKIDLDAMFIWSNMHGLVTISQSNVMQHLKLEPQVHESIEGYIFETIANVMKARVANQ